MIDTKHKKLANMESQFVIYTLNQYWSQNKRQTTAKNRFVCLFNQFINDPNRKLKTNEKIKVADSRLQNMHKKWKQRERIDAINIEPIMETKEQELKSNEIVDSENIVPNFYTKETLSRIVSNTESYKLELLLKFVRLPLRTIALILSFLDAIGLSQISVLSCLSHQLFKHYCFGKPTISIKCQLFPINNKNNDDYYSKQCGHLLLKIKQLKRQSNYAFVNVISDIGARNTCDNYADTFAIKWNEIRIESFENDCKITQQTMNADIETKTVKSLQYWRHINNEKIANDLIGKNSHVATKIVLTALKTQMDTLKADNMQIKWYWQKIANKNLWNEYDSTISNEIEHAFQTNNCQSVNVFIRNTKYQILFDKKSNQIESKLSLKRPKITAANSNLFDQYFYQKSSKTQKFRIIKRSCEFHIQSFTDTMKNGIIQDYFGPDCGPFVILYSVHN